MSAYENSRKQLIRPDLKKLIQYITNFKSDTIEYKQCEAFAFSHILYHNFLSVNKLQVQRTMLGLINKFNAHGLNEKAKKLELLVDEFVNADEFKNHAEIDVQWSILLLLACLSDNPTSLTLGGDLPPVLSKDSLLQSEEELTSDSHEDIFNWGEYLKEGNDGSNLVNNEENDILEWDDVEEEGEEDEKHEEEKSSLKDDSIRSRLFHPKNKTNFVESNAVAKLKSDRRTFNRVNDDHINSERWLKQKIQYNWWNNDALRIEPSSSHPYARLLEHWEELESKHTHGIIPIGGTVSMTEYKVIREALWMLQEPTTTFLFQVSDDGHVSTKPNISIPSLTPDSLSKLLEESFCKYSRIILVLSSFIDDVKRGESEDKKPPYTYQAYAFALHEQISIFSQAVCKIERKILKQESTNTLISVIEELRPEFDKLDFLLFLHKISVCDWRSAQGWFACVKLLSHLFSAVCTSWENKSASISLEIFLKSFRVYIQIIDSWFAEGKLLDDRSEFIVARYDEELKIVAYKEMLEEIKKTEILSIFNTVINASSDLECIRRLDEITALKTEVGKKHDLYYEFLMKVGAKIGKFKDERNDDVEESVSISDSKSGNTHLLENCVNSESQSSSLHPNPSLNFPAKKADLIWYDLVTRKLLDASWLMGAFKEYYPEKERNSEENIENNDSYRKILIEQTGDNSLGFLPVHRIIEDVFISLITERGSIASKIMVEVLMERYKLNQYLSILGNFFVLESSHVVSTFYNALFTKSLINNSVEATENSLNILLDECVEYFTCSKDIELHLSVHVKEPDACSHNIIDCIEIDYKVDWPITLVITNESMETYNSIFKFLVLIKWALHSLHQLRFSDIRETKENFTRLHLLYKLRLFLLHCVSTLHHYFLSFTPSDLRSKFEDALNRSHSLIDIINAHENYLRKLKVHCMLNKRNVFLRVVKQLLCMCADLNKLWRKESSAELKFEEINELEEQYIKAHSILNLLLKNAVELQPNPALQLLSMDIESCLAAETCDLE